MSDLNARCLEAFPEWLKGLGSDIGALVELLTDEQLELGARRWVAGGVNYLFKSLDLIPDGIAELGFIDDVFVVRVAARRALAELGGGAASDVLTRLAADAELIEAFLEEDFARLDSYVGGLSQVAARGRTVDDVLGDAGLRDAFVSEAKAWAESYEAPSFARDEKNLVKLRAFLATKLPG
ncbi:MAG: DUF1232 domain-containing protein [Polyangiaceae bacterium]|nr:DUF1232 domain-containing protein [Polyangiaceae bacterium]MCW5792589.1 DUF1232 domain-containing protein [Polyangiaceae bacterium]